VETRDSEQREFWRHCFHREESDPMLFDLIINTERIDTEGTVSIVRDALARIAPAPEGR
jgi:cytidylate kinase